MTALVRMWKMNKFKWLLEPKKSLVTLGKHLPEEHWSRSNAWRPPTVAGVHPTLTPLCTHPSLLSSPSTGWLTSLSFSSCHASCEKPSLMSPPWARLPTMPCAVQLDGSPTGHVGGSGLSNPSLCPWRPEGFLAYRRHSMCVCVRKEIKGLQKESNFGSSNLKGRYGLEEGMCRLTQ